MARILLTDDDPNVRGPFVRLLGQLGHDVKEAENGKHALTLLRAHTFDVVITDIVMPEMDGFELLIAMKKEFPNCPVVVVSGSSATLELDVLSVARRLGACGALAKPFRLQELVSELDRVMPVEYTGADPG